MTLKQWEKSLTSGRIVELERITFEMERQREIDEDREEEKFESKAV